MAVAVESPLTAFRRELADVLENALGIPFTLRYLHNPQFEREVGCVFPAGSAPHPEFRMTEQLRVGVRVYGLFQPETDPALGIDVERLEQLEQLMKDAIGANQKGLGPWFQVWDGTDYDLEAMMFEALIVAEQENPTSVLGETM